MKTYTYTAPLSEKVKRLLDDPKAGNELLQALARGQEKFDIHLDDRKVTFRPTREKRAADPSEAGPVGG